MTPGGRFSGKYIVAVLSDFKGVSLEKKTRYTKFKFHEHHVEKIALPNEVDGTRLQFPL